jgi:hypothetical protein
MVKCLRYSYGSRSVGIVFFFLLSWSGVRLSPLRTSTTNWPLVPAPDDRWWMWSSKWNENLQGKPKFLEKTCLSANLFITNPTWPGLGSKPGRRGGKPAINSLSYGTASVSLKFRVKRDKETLWTSVNNKRIKITLYYLFKPRIILPY